jgi:hypothetical protein
MATITEYQQLAHECVRWAARAKTEGERMAFLEIARAWTLAAVRVAPVEQQPAETGEYSGGARRAHWGVD